MKKPKLRIHAGLFFLLCPLLAGCTDQDGQIALLKDKIATSQEANNTAAAALQKMNSALTTLNQKVKSQQFQRTEFEGKAKKSGEAAELMTKYRTEMEGSLKQFTESIAAYRKQYLTP